MVDSVHAKHYKTHLKAWIDSYYTTGTHKKNINIQLSVSIYLFIDLVNSFDYKIINEALSEVNN